MVQYNIVTSKVAYFKNKKTKHLIIKHLDKSGIVPPKETFAGNNRDVNSPRCME